MTGTERVVVSASTVSEDAIASHYTLEFDDTSISYACDDDGGRSIAWSDLKSYAILPHAVHLCTIDGEWGSFERVDLGDAAFESLTDMTRRRLRIAR